MTTATGTPVNAAMPNVASLNPDNMTGGGLASDFNGYIKRARFGRRAPQEGKPGLYVFITYVPDADSGWDEFEQWISAGDLDFFKPSQDGMNPTDMDSDNPDTAQGYFALRTGSRESLNNNTNWAHYMQELIAAGFDKTQITADVRFLEGLRGHFQRVPQKKRENMKNARGAQEQKYAPELLVFTKVLGRQDAAAAGSTAAVAAPNGAPAPAAGGAASIDDRLAEAIVMAVANAAGNVIEKQALAGIAMATFTAPNEKGAAIARVNNPAFLSGRPEFKFDPATNKIGFPG